MFSSLYFIHSIPTYILHPIIKQSIAPPTVSIHARLNILFIPLQPTVLTGIWHNVVTALICFWLLLGTPHFLYFLSLEKADGAVVVEIPMSSPFQGSMLVGDVITELEGIRIHSSRDLVRGCGHLSSLDLTSFSHYRPINLPIRHPFF